MSVLIIISVCFTDYSTAQEREFYIKFIVNIYLLFIHIILKYMIY